MKPLRLSVLDQSPVPSGTTPAQALQNSISLARHADALGYTRFWMSEHHSMDLLACTAPEIMLARIGAETTRIRLGSGGIMLPHYTPLKVAETFRTLHALYPDRIDLGIGRAPGGGPIESAALRRNRKIPQPDDFPEQLSELLAFLNRDFPKSHPFAQIRVSPDAPGGPNVWMLGSSLWSSAAAAEYGLPYAFAHFFSPVSTRAAIEGYRRAFVPSPHRRAPEATLAIGVLCAETQKEAEHLHASVRLLQRRIRLNDRRPVESPEVALQELKQWGEDSFAAARRNEEGEFPRYLVGTPTRVAEELTHLTQELEIDEVIVNTITWDHQKRLKSYDLLARMLGPALQPEQEAAGVSALVGAFGS